MINKPEILKSVGGGGVCVRVCEFRYICHNTFVEVRGWLQIVVFSYYLVWDWVSCYSALYVYQMPDRQKQRILGILVSLLPISPQDCWNYQWASDFSMHTGDLNWSPHICMVSALSTEPFPQSDKRILISEGSKL